MYWEGRNVASVLLLTEINNQILSQGSIQVESLLFHSYDHREHNWPKVPAAALKSVTTFAWRPVLPRLLLVNTAGILSQAISWRPGFLCPVTFFQGLPDSLEGFYLDYKAV